jgi:CHAT domain
MWRNGPVVASLWSAPDGESSEISQGFYANLKTGMDKAEAMQQAKLTDAAAPRSGGPASLSVGAVHRDR